MQLQTISCNSWPHPIRIRRFVSWIMDPRRPAGTLNRVPSLPENLQYHFTKKEITYVA
nr:MAG TPA: hypothetical protein [Caudoviricetes sp.]